MTPERLEVARRFVACSKWVWLPGMREASGDRIVAVDNREVCLAEEGATCDDNHASWVSQDGCIPDLADDLTRLGLLAVVRRAWPGYIVRGPSAPLWDPEPTWTVLVGDDAIGEAVEFDGPTEETALLAALEAA